MIQLIIQVGLKYPVSTMLLFVTFLDWSFHAIVGIIDCILVFHNLHESIILQKFDGLISPVEFTVNVLVGTCIQTNVQPPQSVVISQYTWNAAFVHTQSGSIVYTQSLEDGIAVLIERQFVGILQTLPFCVYQLLQLILSAQ